MIPNHLISKDSIVVELPQVTKLFEWRDNNKELVRGFTPILIDLVIQTGGLAIHVEESEKEDYTFRYTVYGSGNKVLIEHWNRDTYRGYEEYNNLPESIQGNLKDYKQSVISLYVSLMAYMEFNKEVVTMKETRKRDRSNKGKRRGKGKRNRVTYLKRRVYELAEDFTTDKVVGVEVEEGKRHYTRPTDPFTVRGHWRHYKNGKRVWIPSYVKNEQKGKNVKPKRYKFT